MKRMEIQATAWEKSFAKPIHDKRVEFKIHKEPVKLIHEKTNNPVTSGRKTWTDASTKETCQQQISPEELFRVPRHQREPS